MVYIKANTQDRLGSLAIGVRRGSQVQGYHLGDVRIYNGEGFCIIAEATAVEAEGMPEIAAGTEVHTGAKVIQPTPPTSKMDRESSDIRRHTVGEVCHDECSCRGKYTGG